MSMSTLFFCKKKKKKEKRRNIPRTNHISEKVFHNISHGPSPEQYIFIFLNFPIDFPVYLFVSPNQQKSNKKNTFLTTFFAIFIYGYDVCRYHRQCTPYFHCHANEKSEQQKIYDRMSLNGCRARCYCLQLNLFVLHLIQYFAGTISNYNFFLYPISPFGD